MIAFSQQGKDVLIDIIPLAEVHSVRDINGPGQWADLWNPKRDNTPLSTQNTNASILQSETEGPAPGSAFNASTPVFSNSRSGQFQDALILETVPDGYNSGRTYHLRAGSQERCREVVASLKARAAAARRRIHARDRLRRGRERLRRLYDSRPFQYAVAALILAVGDRACIQILRDHAYNGITRI